MDKIRVLRIVEYVGPREMVERQVAASIHGLRRFYRVGEEMQVRAATIGEYPEILEQESTPVTQMPGGEDAQRS